MPDCQDLQRRFRTIDDAVVEEVPDAVKQNAPDASEPDVTSASTDARLDRDKTESPLEFFDKSVWSFASILTPPAAGFLSLP